MPVGAPIRAPEQSWPTREGSDGFNEDYVRRLVEGDRFAADHFAAYFGKLLFIKLRRRLQSRETIEDVRQETFLRVLQILRQKGGLQHPERLGAFVNSVCDNVLLERFRSERRYCPMNEAADPADERIDVDAPLIQQDSKRLVNSVLAELSKRDQDLLRMVFLEETDKREACRRLGVGEDYLRVLLFRARLRFAEKLRKRTGYARWKAPSVESTPYSETILSRSAL